MVLLALPGPYHQPLPSTLFEIFPAGGPKQSKSFDLPLFKVMNSSKSQNLKQAHAPSCGRVEDFGFHEIRGHLIRPWWKDNEMIWEVEGPHIVFFPGRFV